MRNVSKVRRLLVAILAVLAVAVGSITLGNTAAQANGTMSATASYYATMDAEQMNLSVSQQATISSATVTLSSSETLLFTGTSSLASAYLSSLALNGSSVSAYSPSLSLSSDKRSVTVSFAKPITMSPGDTLRVVRPWAG